MRNNLPVTQQEYRLGSDQTLVSVTDLKGRITYCNRAFIEVSGYTTGELLGQPHNLVRHPDMPGEAFRDMWSTIQAKLPWTGLVNYVDDSVMRRYLFRTCFFPMNCGC
jgi:aerotaxis receptor